MGKDMPEHAGLLKRLEGVTVALVTPLDGDGQLDTAALERMVERAIRYGCCCVFPLGWTGEQPMLRDSARTAMLRESVRIVNGRLQVMAGVSEQSVPRVLEWAEVAKDAGADLVLATPPYSYPVPQQFVRDFFTEVARGSGMPVVIYRNDEVSVGVDVDTIEQLGRVDGIVGVKGYMPFSELQAAFHRAHRPGRFAVMSGDEALLGPALFLGVRHFTMGTPGNVCLRWCVGLYRSAVDGDWDGVREKHARLLAFCRALSGVGAPFMAVKKYAMSRLGLCGEHVTVPVRRLTPGEKKEVDAVLERFSDVLDPQEG